MAELLLTAGTDEEFFAIISLIEEVPECVVNI